jgi:thiol-disulfide isomerase/thioredoxin
MNKDLKMRTTWFALSMCLSLTSGPAARVALADPMPSSVWKLDFAAAEAEAKSLNRPLVVHFYGTRCPPCKKMEQEVLITPQVLKLLEAGFVAVKVDVVKNGRVSERFGITSMPTDLILSPDGKVLVKTEGYDDIGRAGDRDRQKYLANLSRINSQYAANVKRPEQPKIADRPRPGVGRSLVKRQAGPSGQQDRSPSRITGSRIASQ